MTRIAAIAAAVGFTLWLGSALLDLPKAPLDLRPLLAEALPVSGVTHPVTAVLLNTRGYDTLLEIAVLLVALVGVLVVAPAAKANDCDRAALADDPMVPALARFTAPLALIFAVYVLWAGAHRPGGAFQAAAILAAALVLLHFARLVPAWGAPSVRLRASLVIGFAIFLFIASLMLTGGMLLQYPPDAAGLLILAIESGLTVSLALVLAGLFLFLADGDST